MQAPPAFTETLAGQVIDGPVMSPTVTVPTGVVMAEQPGVTILARYCVVTARLVKGSESLVTGITTLFEKPFVELSQ